jgi:hypothetical protein
MPRVSGESAYYLNGKIPALVLIGEGVRLPPGRWIRVASSAVPPEQVEDMLRDMFPALRGKFIATATLMSDADVTGFEKSMPAVD